MKTCKMRRSQPHRNPREECSRQRKQSVRALRWKGVLKEEQGGRCGRNEASGRETCTRELRGGQVGLFLPMFATWKLV